jgi:hypothetical protein
MGFRVYDNEQKKWVKNNIYLSPDDELFLIKQSLFGMVKVPLALDSERYICHKDINLYDRNKTLVYEGDYIRARVAEDKEEVGLVAYAHELSAYIILCVDSDTFYTLGSNVSEEISVIGNVFDGYEE